VIPYSMCVSVAVRLVANRSNHFLTYIQPENNLSYLSQRFFSKISRG